MNFPSAQAIPDALPTKFSYPHESLGADSAWRGDTSPQKTLFWNGLRAGSDKLCSPIAILRLIIKLFQCEGTGFNYISVPVKNKEEIHFLREKDMPNI